MKIIKENAQLITIIGFIIAVIGVFSLGFGPFGIGFGFHNPIPTVVIIIGFSLYLVGRIFQATNKHNRRK